LKKSTITAVALLGLAVVAVPTAASASNGGAWLLGRSNYESATTTVSNSAGTPLALNARAGYAPFKVNSSLTVKNLSADKFDGLDNTSYAKTYGKTGTIVHDSSTDGWGAACPAGSVFVSGGGATEYVSDNMLYSGPDWNPDTKAVIPNSWLVINWDASMGSLSYGKSYVTCYNPSGAAVAGAATNYAQLFPQSSTLAAAAAPSQMAQDKLAQFKTSFNPSARAGK
jgi:hypothetical protein